MKDINKKNGPNQMRIFLGRIYGSKKYKNENSTNEPEKDLNVRDMLKITRNINLNEEEEATQEPSSDQDLTPTQDNVEQQPKVDKETVYDQPNEEQKLLNYFRDMPVNIKFIDLKVFDDLVFWGGTIDGIIQFIYKVTANGESSGVEYNYLEDFSPDNPQNDEIIKRVDAYYEIFDKYWQSNILQP